MKILQLTQLGENLASSPGGVTTGRRILYYLRRKGGRATDEQIYENVSPDKGDSIISAIRRLQPKFITVIG
jgi:hypothetical protein